MPDSTSGRLEHAVHRRQNGTPVGLGEPAVSTPAACWTARYALVVQHPPRTRWRDSAPTEVGSWLAATKPPWWIAGGWAVDLHLGRQTRPHADLDAGCFREDLAELRRSMVGWEFYVAREGTLARLEPGAAPAAGANSVWCYPSGAYEWWLQIVLDERDGPDWVFRRCPRVRRPTGELTLAAPDGTRYLRPEVQLLYKAKAAQEKDEADLEALLPVLGRGERGWLANALEAWDPGHHWLSIFRGAVRVPSVTS